MEGAATGRDAGQGYGKPGGYPCQGNGGGGDLMVEILVVVSLDL